MLHVLLRLGCRCLSKRCTSGVHSSVGKTGIIGSNIKLRACQNVTLTSYSCLPRTGSLRLRRSQCRDASLQFRCLSSRASEVKHGVAEPGSEMMFAHSKESDHREEDNGIGSSEHSANSFYFDAGYALFAKRPSRPFPPPFASGTLESAPDAPNGQVFETGQQNPGKNGENGGKKSKDEAGLKHEATNGMVGKTELTQDLQREIRLIKGITNGDDAILANERFIGANDGVGAWATKENGHAALWSRLIVHFWALEAEKDAYGNEHTPDPVGYLQRAFDKVREATNLSGAWLGTTTACSALLSTSKDGIAKPIIYATQLGDSGILIFRPEDGSTLFKTVGQWHWFDCPRQLGTNSPDEPQKNAVTDRVEIQEGDVVLAVTDGVLDNLWDHEVAHSVFESLKSWERDKEGGKLSQDATSGREKMRYVAQELVKAAREVAEDPFAESPYMEKAIEEGISIEGGKLDDISVVAAQCRRYREPVSPNT